MAHSYPEGVYEVIRILSDHFKDSHPVSLLDIGCGDGFYGILFRKLFPRCKITGIEINPKNIQKYNCRYDSAYSEVIKADIKNRLDLIDQYELIFMGDVIEHMEKYVGKEIMNRSAKYIVITPFGQVKQNPSLFGYDIHISEWYPRDFDMRIKFMAKNYEKIAAWKV